MGDISTERSMEDILSSIKRIIAEEGDVGSRPRRPRAPEPAPRDIEEADEAVLELADYADEPSTTCDAESFEPVEPEPEPEPEPVIDPAPRRARSEEAILSERTAQATRGSLDALSKLIVRPQVSGADTLEGLVRDMLRPMLSDWLDAHLPEIVERIVQREVERLTKR
jgi:cell pole-organizing protein PopZ